VSKAVLIEAVPPMMLKSAKSVLKTYPGVAHGMCTTHPEIINADTSRSFAVSCYGQAGAVLRAVITAASSEPNVLLVNLQP
jgi:hypothetical protein